MPRTATIQRKTAETEIQLTLNLDGSGVAQIKTGIGFFDHMLTLLAKHALFDLTIVARGDLHVDFHHTVEDVGICLGKALAEALGNKQGIVRYGSKTLPIGATRKYCSRIEPAMAATIARALRCWRRMCWRKSSGRPPRRSSDPRSR